MTLATNASRKWRSRRRSSAVRGRPAPIRAGALAGVGFGIGGRKRPDRTSSRRCPGRWTARRSRSRSDQAVEVRADPPCFLLGIADHHKGPGQDLQMLGVAADGDHAPLDIGIKRAALLQRARGDKTPRGFRGLAPGLRRAGCTITGQPPGARCSGPRTFRWRPAWSRRCSLSGSKYTPLSASRMKASSAQLSQSPVTTS